MKRIRVAALFCTAIFAIAVCVAQSPGAQPNSAPMATPAAQSPQTATPSQGVPSNAPSAESAPQHSQPRMSNIDEQVKVLSDQLNLKPDQQSKVRSILMDQHQQVMALIQDNSLAREAKVDKIHSLRASTIAKVRETLTDDQRPKFDAMVQQQDERMRERQQQEQSGSSASPGATTPATPSNSSPSSTGPAGNSPAGTLPSTNPPTSTKPPR